MESAQESKMGDPGRGSGHRKQGGHSSTCANCVPRQSCSDDQGNQLWRGAGGTGIPNKSARHRTRETLESRTLLSHLVLQGLLLCHSPEQASFSCTVCGQQWLWILSLTIAALGPIRRQGRCGYRAFGLESTDFAPPYP